jgi:hypothetical protein
MSDTIEYRPLPISTDDLLRLEAAVGDRDRNLELTRIRADGEAHIMVTIKGVKDALFAVRRAKAETGKEGARPPKPCWLVHPSNGDGPMYEFPAVVDVANFLAFGDAQRCKRSWMTGRSEPGRIVGGELPAAVQRGRDGVTQRTYVSSECNNASPTASLDTVRGRRVGYPPMLGDRAGE